ncbi:hypothetical protein BH10PSE2_BH10PSE2_00340 [soil metagenome]
MLKAVFASSRRIALAVLGASTVVACAPVPPGSQPEPMQTARTCFLPALITNFRQDQGQTLYLRTGRVGVYELETTGYCRDLETTNKIAVTPGFGSGRLCVGDWGTVSVLDTGATCRVRVVKQLTDADLAALPGRISP